MKKENAYHIGKIVKPHALAGEVGVSFIIDYPEEYVSSEVLFLEEKGSLVPYFIEYQSFNGTKGIFKFEGIDTIEGAEGLRGMDFYIPLKDLPELEEGQVYFHELIGFQVHGVEEGFLGEVNDIYDFKSHAVMEIFYQGKEVLIPLHEDIIDNIDEDAQIIRVNLPEGLLDLYLKGDLGT